MSIYKIPHRYKLLIGIIFITTSWSNPALALSFGPVKVKSTLGQSLNAEVSIYGTKSEIRNATIKMAKAEEYEKLGIDYNHYLRNIEGEYIQPNDKSKRAYFKFFTKIPFYEVNANIIIEAVWPEGRSIKSISLILDPSENIQGISRGLNSSQGARFDLPGQATIIREDIPYQDTPLDEGYFAFTPTYQTPKVKKSIQTPKRLKAKSTTTNSEVTAKQKELKEINQRIQKLQDIIKQQRN